MLRLKFISFAMVLTLALAACSSSPSYPTSSSNGPSSTSPSSLTPGIGAATSPTVKVATDPTLGNILTDTNGMTLYLYTKDNPNVSNCYDQCAQNWPPLTLTSGQPVAPEGLPGTLGLTTRTDGTKQVTYNGAPLYLWVKDAKPGDTTGQGVGGVWYVIIPKAQ